MIPVSFLIPLLLLVSASDEAGLTQSSTSPPDLDQLWELEESYLYEVRYGFMRLGNIEVEVHTRDTVYNDKTARQFTNIIKSNPRVPVIGRREVHYHTMLTRNDTIPYGLKFWSDNHHDDIMEEYVYEFDYENEEARFFNEGEKKAVNELKAPADGGPAIFYYSRMHAGTDRTVEYPIYVDEDAGQVKINNRSEISEYDSEAFGGEVDSYGAEGKADFEGPFGFSGDFEAVFKANELRVPLEAKVSVWIGNVTVRLVEYERHN